MRVSKRIREAYLELVDQYVRETRQTTYTIGELVAWGMGQGRLQMSPAQKADFHAWIFSESLRADRLSDCRGREVRARHCVTVRKMNEVGKSVPLCLWSHIDDATDEFLLESFRSRKAAIRSDLLSLKADFDFVNERRQVQGKRPFQMTFDFGDLGESPPSYMFTVT
jgi:hypothetical protein